MGYLRRKKSGVIGGSDVVKKTTKLNVTAPYTHEVTLGKSFKLDEIVTSIFSYVGGDSGIVHYQADFNNGDASNFNSDSNIVFINGFMKIRDEWDYTLNEIELNSFYETGEIDFSAFTDFGEDVVIDTFALKVTIKGLQGVEGIGKANGDISIVGVDALESIQFVTQASGGGKSLLAISFDGGLNYVAYNGTQWINVDTNNYADFKVKGMPKAIVDALTNDELITVRGENNSLRFAYYLERPTYIDTAQNDTLSLFVTMKGHNEIAGNGSFNYNYDEVTKKLTFNFTVSGTFQINYVDVP